MYTIALTGVIYAFFSSSRQKEFVFVALAIIAIDALAAWKAEGAAGEVVIKMMIIARRPGDYYLGHLCAGQALYAGRMIEHSGEGCGHKYSSGVKLGDKQASSR